MEKRIELEKRGRNHDQVSIKYIYIFLDHFIDDESSNCHHHVPNNMAA